MLRDNPEVLPPTPMVIYLYRFWLNHADRWNPDFIDAQYNIALGLIYANEKVIYRPRAQCREPECSATYRKCWLLHMDVATDLAAVYIYDGGQLGIQEWYRGRDTCSITLARL